jgi:phosphatidylserine/phosphatidylglycerophosphate/cardiolipin synthase-like enzyme
MPTPPSPDVPYEHAKMMIADGKRAFIGSINFSTASTTDARELGVFFDDAAAIKTISDDFEHDWAHGVKPPAASEAHCPPPPGA